MKKAIITGLVLSALIMSCSKADRVCECTYEDGSKESITYLEKTNKKQAKEECEGFNNTKTVYTDTDGSTETDEDKGTKCELK
jgi:hypothetical protein